MRQRRKKDNFYLWFLFSAYVIIICWLLFFQVGATNRDLYFTTRTIHFIPFESTYHSIKLALSNNFGPPHKIHFRYITARNIVGNIFLFFPWGIMAPVLFPKFKTLKKVLICTVIFSSCVEIVQFLLVIGVTDIDDVLLNTIGALIGFYAFLLLLKQEFIQHQQIQK